MTLQHNMHQRRAATLKSPVVHLALYALSHRHRRRIPPIEAMVRREGRRHA